MSDLELARCPYYQAQNGWRPVEGATCGPKTCHEEPLCMWLGPGGRPFGSHAVLDVIPPLFFPGELGEDGLPVLEYHEECKCDLPLA